mmetsp:Transcript_4761/g.13873  ORF Transcript_4761/g.13873 Transcript_4761/m.13873 type:complete len:220 (-) Transcript_4761:189-848(-)
MHRHGAQWVRCRESVGRRVPITRARGKRKPPISAHFVSIELVEDLELRFLHHLRRLPQAVECRIRGANHALGSKKLCQPAPDPREVLLRVSGVLRDGDSTTAIQVAHDLGYLAEEGKHALQVRSHQCALWEDRVQCTNRPRAEALVRDLEHSVPHRARDRTRAEHDVTDAGQALFEGRIDVEECRVKALLPSLPQCLIRLGRRMPRQEKAASTSLVAKG